MGVLGAGLGPEVAGLVRVVFLAQGFDDVFPGRLPRLFGDAGRIGTHVGDEGHRAPFAEFQTFIELLGRAHGAFGRIAQALVGRLLEGGGDKRRGRRLLAFLFGDGADHEGIAPDGGLGGFGVRGVADGQLLAGVLDEVRLEFRRDVAGQFGLENPVFFRHESPTFLFPIHHQPQGHGLDPAGGDAAFDLGPQDGRYLVADQSVEDAAGLLGQEQLFVDLAGVGQGLAHGPGRDFVELDAANGRVGVLEELGDVPGDGLSLAVGVRGQIDLAGVGGGLLELGNHLLFAWYDLIVGGEILILVHTEILGRQIPHMSHRGFHGIGIAEEFLDGLYLGRRLDDNKVLSHGRRAIATPPGQGKGCGLRPVDFLTK